MCSWCTVIQNCNLLGFDQRAKELFVSQKMFVLFKFWTINITFHQTVCCDWVQRDVSQSSIEPKSYFKLFNLTKSNKGLELLESHDLYQNIVI